MGIIMHYPVKNVHRNMVQAGVMENVYGATINVWHKQIMCLQMPLPQVVTLVIIAAFFHSNILVSLTINVLMLAIMNLGVQHQ